MRDLTALSHLGEDRHEFKGAVVPPIFQNSLFTFEGWDAIDKAYDDPQNANIYTRGNNPSATLPEKKIARLCHGEKAKLFASGMGAISSAILSCVNYGDHIVTVNNVYGPANQFMGEYLRDKMNVTTTFVDGRDIKDFEDAINEKTKLIYLESPSSAVFYLQDIEAVANLAKSKGIKTIIDNTWATPIFQHPLDLGIDIEVHSCSKYIGGHSDIIAGVVISTEEHINKMFSKECAWLGAKIAPFEAWLITRSLRTLPIRVKQHQENTGKILEFLEQHDKIKNIKSPGSKNFEQKELANKQMSGFTGLLSFELDTEELEEVKAFVNALKYFELGVSWGGHESLVYAPAISYVKELSPEKFKALGISYGVIRISVGLEDPEDLIEDLENALKNIKK